MIRGKAEGKEASKGDGEGVASEVGRKPQKCGDLSQDTKHGQYY